VKKHTDWLTATIPAPTLKVYVSLAVNADRTPVKLPYVMVHPSDGSDQSDRVTGPAVIQNPRWVIHSVGSTYEQAAWAAELVKSKLIAGGFGVTPTIPGEIAGRVWYESPQPIQVDTDASPPYCYHTAECGFESSPVSPA
jgi:hypothetical protein